jgi:hypothetical protein
MEHAREAFVDEHDAGAGVVDFPNLYTAELLAQEAEHLDRAAARVIDAPERYRRRVEFVRTGLTFTEPLAENTVSMVEYWRYPKASIAGKVQKNWQAIERLCQEHPYAVNWGPVRPQTPRMRGLHPIIRTRNGNGHPGPRGTTA